MHKYEKDNVFKHRCNYKYFGKKIILPEKMKNLSVQRAQKINSPYTEPIPLGFVIRRKKEFSRTIRLSSWYVPALF